MTFFSLFLLICRSFWKVRCITRIPQTHTQAHIDFYLISTHLSSRYTLMRSQRDSRADRYAPRGSTRSSTDPTADPSSSSVGGGRSSRTDSRYDRRNSPRASYRTSSRYSSGADGEGRDYYKRRRSSSEVEGRDSYRRAPPHSRFTEAEDSTYGRPRSQQQQQPSASSYNHRRSRFGSAEQADRGGERQRRSDRGGAPSFHHPPSSEYYPQDSASAWQTASMPTTMPPMMMPPQPSSSSAASGYFPPQTDHTARILQLVQDGNMASPELARLLAEQQTMLSGGQQSSFNGAPGGTEANPPSSATLPSVEDFIPAVPKSLLSDFKMNEFRPSLPDMQGSAAGSFQPSPADGALMAFQAPKVAPEVERRAREARRAHISGFPSHTTPQALTNFFLPLLPRLRREKTIREMSVLAEQLNIPEEERQTLPSYAQTNNVDVIRDLTVNTAKSKRFAFIELNLADMVTELVELSEREPGRFVYEDQNRSYPLLIRRPRDYSLLDGVDECKLVMTGFPPTLPEAKLKEVLEEFGTVLKFDCKEQLAYAEFATKEEVLHCREELHGVILASRMIVVFPLYDWLKVMCAQAGIDVTIADDDPISGKAVLETVAAEVQREKQEMEEKAAHGVLTLAKNAPTTASHLMQSLAQMSLNLHEAVAHLTFFYPHLRPLYGNAQCPAYPTRVLALINMFDEEELIQDATYSALLAEIEAEVEQYGCVEQVVIPRRQLPPARPTQPGPRQSYASQQEEEAAQQAYEEAKKTFKLQMDEFYEEQKDPVKGGFGLVFVVYSRVEEAEEAQIQLAGKLFGGRTVITSFIFEDLLLSPEEVAADRQTEGLNDDVKEDNEEAVGGVAEVD